jgi:D-alanyl-D-alanine carboxypeptidase
MTKKKRYRINPVRFILSIIITVTIIIALIYGATAIFKTHSKSEPPASEPGVTEPEGEEQREPEMKKNYGINILVNAENPLPDDYKKPKTVKLIGIVDVKDENVAVAEEVVDPLEKLMRAAQAAGATGLYVTSGYRSYNTQKKIYDEAEDKSYVQPPNCSEHQTGLAVDIAKLGEDLQALGDDFGGKWIYENSWRYGFIVRYPQDKVDITGISYEPWHLRYVGKKVAKICYEENLCLEEYIEKYVTIE